MITTEEVLRSLYAAWRLLWRDQGALGLLDATPAGAARSFFAWVIGLPLFLAPYFLPSLVGNAGSGAAVSTGLTEIILTFAVTYALAATVFVTLLREILRLTGSLALFPVGLCAYNWSVPISGAVGFVALIVLIILPPAIGGLALIIELGVGLFLLSYEWFVLRVALRLSGFGAAGLVVMNFFLTIMITNIPILLLTA